MKIKLLLLAVLTAGCASVGRIEGPAGMAAMDKRGVGGSQGVSSSAPASTQVPRQLIRRGGIHADVEDVNASRVRMERATAALGAEIAKLDVDQNKRVNFLLRVPPGRLEALMDSAASLGHVTDRTVSADDVTDRVVDAEGRLSALRGSRDRLKNLLDRAASVSEVITVERELARVQADLESMEARLNALKSQVVLSELAVRLDRKVVLGPLALLAQGIGAVVEKLFIWR